MMDGVVLYEIQADRQAHSPLTLRQRRLRRLLRLSLHPAPPVRPTWWRRLLGFLGWSSP